MGKGGRPHKNSAVSAEDLKLAEFILTKGEERSKRKGSEESTDVDNEALFEENNNDDMQGDYEESEEEVAMIMKKGKIYFAVRTIVLVIL